MFIDKDLVAASATPLVLGILAEGESYGYAIIKRVNELSDGRMQWTDGMLYPLLHRLERAGCISASWSTGSAGMGVMDVDTQLESQIAQWRGYVSGHRVIAPSDVDELEEHLREQVSDLSTAGLTSSEAFLVAVGRMGSVDDISREFAREHSDRLWKQLVLVSADPDGGARRRPRELGVVLALAVAAGPVVKAGADWLPEQVLVRSLSILVLRSSLRTSRGSGA